jgi:adenosylcobinamide-GDP ribazoletransferase
VLATVVSATTARLALTLAARDGVPAARPEGLGAAVAGVVPVRAAAVTATVVVGAAAAGGALAGTYDVIRTAVAVLAALGAAELLLRHCTRRFGGVTGDVFGGVAETAATVSLLVLSLGQ